MVLCLSQDGACTESSENFRDNSLKGCLSNDVTLNPPLLSLENTFKYNKNLRLNYSYGEDCDKEKRKKLSERRNELGQKNGKWSSGKKVNSKRNRPWDIVVK